MKAITWDELADDYRRATGRTAKTRPMETIFAWAEAQTDKYIVHKDGTLHRKGRKP